MAAGELVLDELRRRKLGIDDRGPLINVLSAQELVQYCQPRQPGRGIYAGQVNFRMFSGSIMPIGLMVEWDTEDVVVYWGQLTPEPGWTRLSERVVAQHTILNRLTYQHNSWAMPDRPGRASHDDD